MSGFPPNRYGFTNGAPYYPSGLFRGPPPVHFPAPSAPTFMGQVPLSTTVTNHYPSGETHFTSYVRPVHVQNTTHQAPRWIQWDRHHTLPPHAVEAGYDVDGAKIYVGRMHHEGDLLPAKVIPKKGGAFVPYGGSEIPTFSCEVLCHDNVKWVPCTHGNVPPGATVGGHTSSGEALYVARVHHKGSLTVGKVHPSHKVCYIPFGGKEVAHTNYEVLVIPVPTAIPHNCPRWIQWDRHHTLPPHAVEAGYDVDGAKIYVGRMHHEGDLLPAKVIPKKGGAFVPYGGSEIPTYSCEVLCHEYVKWIPCTHGNVPPGATVGGHTSSGEALYVARVHHKGSLTVGKVHPSHKVCYIPFGGEEVRHTNYEVLVTY